MCGIVGFTWEDKKLLRKMTELVAHRGPDSAGFYCDSGISLGHRRLVIMDLSKKGNQPLVNEEGDVFVIVNGEIYNFKKLREILEKKGHCFSSNSDSEVIVHGYEEYGDNVSSYLEGMFAFALWDSKKRKLILSRDRIGERPLYYAFDGKQLLFASEIKALLQHDIPLEIDIQCLSDYLTLRASQGTRTMFKGIVKLAPGTLLIYRNSRIKVRRYWQLPPFSSEEANLGHFRALMQEALEERLMSDVPLGVFLSGGLDSSSLVASLSRVHEQIKTFSLGFNDPTDELKYARIVAERFHTDHTEIIVDQDVLKMLPKIVWHLDEPMADPAVIPTYLISEKTAEKVKVVLSGEGGDEIFGGYHTMNYVDWVKHVDALPWLFRFGVGRIADLFSRSFQYPYKQKILLGAALMREQGVKRRYQKLFYFPFEEEEKAALLGNTAKQVSLETAWDHYVNGDLLRGAFQYYFNEYLPNDLLIKADRMGLAHGLEIRVPYLDIGLVEYSCKLHPRYKHHRALFRRVVKDLLPREILHKKKQGFTMPLSRWFMQKEFSSRFSQHFEDLGKRKIFDPSTYRKILERPTEFKNDHRLWVLLNFELWCKIYLDGMEHRKIHI